MQRYSRVAMALHWLLAIMLAFQMGLGWGLEGAGRQGFASYQLHKSIGITIFALTLLRIVVRYWKPRPAPIEGGFTGALAHVVHFGLYLFMLGGPLTGWALVSTAKVKVPTLIFGLVPLPHLPVPVLAHELFEGGHGLLAIIGFFLILLHVAGAVRHQFLIRDHLIWRMVPGKSAMVMIALIASVPAALLIGRSMTPQEILPTAAAASADNPAGADNGSAGANMLAPVEEADNVAVAENIAAAAEIPVTVPVWAIQPGGRLGFSVGNGASPVSGSFSRWSASIAMDPDRPESADIRVEIDLASASVGDATQDGMLAGEEYFGVASHPRAVFVAKGARQSGNGYTASGTLALKGMRKPLDIAFTLSGSGLNRKVSGTASVTREAFDIGMGESGAGLDPVVAIRFAFDAKGTRS